MTRRIEAARTFPRGPLARADHLEVDALLRGALDAETGTARQVLDTVIRSRRA